MSRTRIISIIGTRPQIIKNSILGSVLSSYFDMETIFTGQHHDPSLFQSQFADLKAPVPIELPSTFIEGSRTERLGRMVQSLLPQLDSLQPQYILVYGDTDSTLAGALASQEAGIPFLHIESGERSFNPEMPEEYNRLKTDELAFARFCVSELARQQLEAEGISKNVFVCGDIMKDLLLKMLPSALSSPYPFEYYFATLHRNYNQSDPNTMAAFLEAMDRLPFKVIFSLHPSTRKSFDQHEINYSDHHNILFIEPLSYSACIRHQKYAKGIITDSGGIQKEAYWLKVPCITLRKETEWTATLEEGWNQLCYNAESLPGMLANRPGKHDNHLYGDGNACNCMLGHLLDRDIFSR